VAIRDIGSAIELVDAVYQVHQRRNRPVIDDEPVSARNA
jgi:hypothetical protein